MRVLVTGAASGIGRAAALELARTSRHAGERSQLLLVDVDAAALDAVCRDAMALGAEADAVVGDLADPAVPERVVAEAGERMGGLDALVSNAGVLSTAALRDLTLEEYDRAFAINTRATWLLAKHAHPLLARSRGSLVATGSVSGEHPTPPHGAYSASKAALIMLVRQLAFEWGPDGIRCNVVSPGTVHTGMTDAVYGDADRKAERASHIPLRRVAGPDDLAKVIAFLVSPDAAYVTGVNLPVDGGLQTSLMPLARRFDLTE